MHLNTLLLDILATTTIAAADLKPRNYGAMLLPRQESLIACSELGLESCVASTACCTAGVTCDGTGCCPIGETCTGVPTIHTLLTDVSATPTDSNSATFLTTPAMTTEDSAASTDNSNTITTPPATAATTNASPTPSAASSAAAPVTGDSSPYFLAALGYLIAGFF